MYSLFDETAVINRIVESWKFKVLVWTVAEQYHPQFFSEFCWIWHRA